MSTQPISVSATGPALYFTKNADGTVESRAEGGNTYRVTVGNDQAPAAVLHGPTGSESTLIQGLLQTPIDYDSPFIFPPGKADHEQLLNTIIQKATSLQSNLVQQQALNICTEIRRHLQAVITYTDQASSEVAKAINKAEGDIVKTENEYTTVAQLLKSAQHQQWSSSLQFCLNRLNSRKTSIQNAITHFAQTATNLKTLNTNLKAMLAKYDFLKTDVSFMKDLIRAQVLDQSLVSVFINDVQGVEGSFRALN